MTKNIFYNLLLIIIILFSFIFSSSVFAQEASPQPSSPNLQNAFHNVDQVSVKAGYKTSSSNIPGENQKIFSIIGVIINTIFSILGIIFVVLTILAGYRWMTAAGNEEQVSSAKKSLRQSIIGLVIIVLTWGAWAIIGRLANLF